MAESQQIVIHLGDRITAVEAQASGLVSKVFPSNILVQEAIKVRQSRLIGFNLLADAFRIQIPLLPTSFRQRRRLRASPSPSLPWPRRPSIAVGLKNMSHGAYMSCFRLIGHALSAYELPLQEGLQYEKRLFHASFATVKEHHMSNACLSFASLTFSIASIHSPHLERSQGGHAGVFREAPAQVHRHVAPHAMAQSIPLLNVSGCDRVDRAASVRSGVVSA